MDVSAQTLREVEFREKLRGYHPDDVDEFLERVAAGIEYLQDRLRQATERAQRAEARAAESTDGDDALKRTLVLAQRTAELAVSEARQEADRIAASARAEAQAIVSQAEEMARRTIEETQGGIRAELDQLEAARDQLRSDIVGLEQHLDQERSRLRASLTDALQVVEEHLSPLAPAPRSSEVVVPKVRRPKVGPLPELDRDAIAPFLHPADDASPSPGDPEPLDELLALAASDLAPPAPVPSEPPAARDDDLAGREDDHEPFTAMFSIHAEPEPEADMAPESDPPAENDSWAAAASGPAVRTTVKPQQEPEAEVAEAVGASDDEDDEDDPFIAELRRAITDTQPLGPREESDVTPGTNDHDLAHGDVLDGSRLGSLLRRRR
jgi:cell division initiation protein